jgi:hypothetical protein
MVENPPKSHDFDYEFGTTEIKFQSQIKKLSFEMGNWH